MTLVRLQAHKLDSGEKRIIHRGVAPSVFGEVVPPQARADMESAKGLTIAALVLYGVFGVLFLLLWVAFPSPFFLFFGAVPLLFLILTLALVYAPLSEGRPGSAKGPALALGIISIFVGGIISAILLLVAYSKIQSAHTAITFASGSPFSYTSALSRIATQREQPTTPLSAATGREPRFCPACGSALSPPFKFCTHCGSRVQ